MNKTRNAMERRETANSPAMIAYSAVHASNTLALVVRLHDGASCPPCPASISPPDVRNRAGERAWFWCRSALTVATATARVNSSVVRLPGSWSG